METPVGMTILLCPQELQRETLDPRNRIVIPTGADQDFLLRAASGVYVCGFLQENRMTLINATDLDRKSGGSVVEGPAVVSPVLTHPLQPGCAQSC
jgi:hypothetical protein